MIKVDPAKIAGVVQTDLEDETRASTSPRRRRTRSAATLRSFWRPRSVGPHPEGFLPIQSGVGNIANAVLAALGKNKEFRHSRCTRKCFRTPCALIQEDRVKFAVHLLLTVSHGSHDVYETWNCSGRAS